MLPVMTPSTAAILELDAWRGLMSRFAQAPSFVNST
jgi:hypothetical protein